MKSILHKFEGKSWSLLFLKVQQRAIMAENNLDPQGDHNIGNDSSGAQQRTVQIDGIAATDTNSLNMGLRDSQGSSSVQTDRTLVSSIPSESSNRTQQMTLHTDGVSASDNNVVHMTVHNSQVRPSLQADGIAMSPFQLQSGEGSRLRTVQTDGISGSNSIGLGLRQRHVEALLQPEDIDEEEMNLDERQWHIEPPPSSLEDVSTSGSDSNVVTSEPRVSTNIPQASASNSANGLLENGATRDPGPLASATSGSSPPSSMFNSLSRLFFTDPQATKSPAAPLECPHKSKGCKAVSVVFKEQIKMSKLL